MPTPTTAALAQLLAALRPHLAQQEAWFALYGEPQDSPAYHQLVAALADAESALASPE
ncbi:hypothetical protein KBZ18_16170 [Synechococcus sp. Cruz-9H2]|uniref:hypothetical protein n=1 Tax=unclassified Synechococcus TaxID=2626047 RepID=UPI0020CC628F|nr:MULTISPECIES: hypothetical protein [unclassified Synechococcus]MCP9821016.1 hypothetical protein [Synechococcus sp. Cruz-9H2]MCP9845243.1 hypothetical protein [Synechococcus sp. Edmonson 11F2]MCP9857414.1 hypothetical protein [Synechococcus sp. Cruz-9C9]MCP9864665.1 hypothetical protein [Synechococcus sp. Cruz-7E5]MCP9871934.1 hypothetical protein [Synechococcus sp. Cruz-7B9]